MGNGYSIATVAAPAPNPNPPRPTAIGPWIACVVAVLCVVALFVFVFVNRRKSMGRLSDTGGARVVDITLPNDLLSAEDHQKAMSSKDVIVVHHSNNCGFCKKFKPVIMAVADEMGLRVVFSEVSSSAANQEAFGRLQVNGVPAYTMGDKKIGVGYKDGDTLKSELAAASK